MIKKIVFASLLLGFSSVEAFEPVESAHDIVAMVDPDVLSSQNALENARRLMVVHDADPIPQPILDIQSLRLSELVGLYFKDFSSNSYVICSEVLSDNRMVSIRADGDLIDEAVLSAVLKNNGYRLDNIGGVSYVCSEPAEITREQLSGKKGELFTYSPKHRSVTDLARLSSPVVFGVFANNLESLSDNQGLATSGFTGADDILIFSGEADQVRRLRSLIEALDVPTTRVEVRAVLFEVIKRDHQASALSVISNLLKGKFGITIGSGLSILPNSISYSSDTFNAVASIVSEDSRFNVLSTPFVHVRNGQTTTFQSGTDVSVAGDVVINPSGQATQGQRYMSSGTIFTVTANIRSESIDLDIVQTVSHFSQSSRGASVNPDLHKREIRTSTTVNDGEITILGGLYSNQDDNTAQGLFGFNPFKSRTKTETEMIMMIFTKRV